MRLREENVDYEVIQHGMEYQEPIKDEPVFLCPECCSDDVRGTNKEDISATVYICKACGCEFYACKGYERTELGNIVRGILLMFMVLLLIGAVVSFVAGLVLADQFKDAGGSLTRTKDILLCIGLSVGVPIVLCIASAWLSSVRDRI